MPWEKENGGGPWGQGPGGTSGGGKRPGNRPPDLEEMIKRSREQFGSLWSGGFNFLPVILIIIALIWAVQSVYTVQAEEQAVVLRFGKYNRTAAPGLHFLLWPIERVTKVRILAENIDTFAGKATPSSVTGDGAGILMLAGDQNIVDVEFTVLWRISDAPAYLFNIQQPRGLLRVVAESAMREYVSRNNAEVIRTRGRDDAQIAVVKLIQETLDGYKAGISITGVQLNNANPPAPVLDAFAEVNRAQQDSSKAVNEANQYAFQRAGQSKGEAAKIREGAEAYKDRTIAEAQGEAQRFSAVYSQYRQARDVTRQRLYIETMEEVLTNTKKMILDPSISQRVLPHFPLPQVLTAPAVVPVPITIDKNSGEQP